MSERIGISDIGTQLFKKIGAAIEFTKLVDIVAAPATGAAPDSLDGTVLNSPRTQNVKGRLNTPDMEFDYNYTESNFAKVRAAVTGDVEEFLIVYGDGSGALITGEAETWVDAVTRNSVVVGKLHITAQDVEYKTADEVLALVDTLGEGEAEGEAEGESEAE